MSFVVDYTPKDTNRIETHLKKLLNHVDLNEFILTGGMAIRYHIISNGLEYPIRETNDLDSLLSNSAALKPTVKNNFLISHYHIYDSPNRDRFYFVVVDEETKTKMDFFDAKPMPPKSVEVGFKGIKMRSAEDQFCTKLIEMARVLVNEKIDKKWLVDLKLLHKIINKNEVKDCWAEYMKNPYFQKDKTLQKLEGARGAWESITNHLEANPSLLQENVHHRKEPYECKDCVHTKEFPITPMEKIYKVLGYIE